METKISNNDDFFIKGFEEKRKEIEELSEKLVEARKIAEKIASTEILISNKRQIDVKEYIHDLRREFRTTFRDEPSEFLLVAKSQTREIHIRLNV